PHVTRWPVIRFLDGPASGQSLLLRRAPLYVRVVRTAAGKWDALDQLGDEPAFCEAVFAYRRTGRPGWVHICGGKARGRFQTGDYRFVLAQPDEDTLRDQSRWRQWATQRYDEER